ncbi:beta-lactamase/transpeptidase-like protein [Xylaria digitata]|nr:beta-lactamase/transpeptidase-like protein [Xylaria digitata]
MYALAGHIVERISEHSNWGDFQRERIFRPLGMNRTTAFRSVHETDDNIATPYMILTDGSTSGIAPTELSADSMNGGSGGIRSSVNNLLKWCECLLGAFDAGSDNPSLIRLESPIFDRLTIADPQSGENGDYCTGWCYHQTPGKLGLISPNRALISSVIGRCSPSLLLYGHQGDVPGHTCSIYIVPETKSAMVVLSNGTGLSDASDWIAQDLLQTMHCLQPPIDFVNMATQARAKYLDQYSEHYIAPLEKHRVLGTRFPHLEEFLGSYTMKDLDVVCIDINKASHDATKLQMTINKQTDQTLDLWHYHFDVFCHLPDCFDACLIRGFYRDTWDSTLISFKRNNVGEVTSLCWTLNGVDVVFSRE